jgi:hypothetical protein
MSIQLDNRINEYLNPLDSVEEILSAHNWEFNRMNNDELMVQVIGKACEYRLFFIWQEDMSALQFCCQYDLGIHPKNTEAASRMLMRLNESLWMGHFDIPADTKIPSFRQTCLMRGMTDGGSLDYIEDLVDISMALCERYHCFFHLLSIDAPANDQMLSLALMDTTGAS